MKNKNNVDREMMERTIKNIQSGLKVEHSCIIDDHKWKTINEITYKKSNLFGKTIFFKTYIQQCDFCGRLLYLNLKLGNWMLEDLKEKIK
jgi:hypothetical protein